MSNGASNAVDRSNVRSFTLLDLAPGGVCRASDITVAAGGLLRHRFTLAGRKCNFQPAIHLSVALSVGSPRPAVSRHHALRSADFPRPTNVGRDHPVNLTARW